MAEAKRGLTKEELAFLVSKYNTPNMSATKIALAINENRDEDSGFVTEAALYSAIKRIRQNLRDHITELESEGETEKANAVRERLERFEPHTKNKKNREIVRSVVQEVFQDLGLE
jgi:hypothetical protein